MKPEDNCRAVAAGLPEARTHGEVTRREVSSAELFGDARVVLIRHADAVYLLRRTSSGKLILTK